jgi:hypothetical protein
LGKIYGKPEDSKLYRALHLRVKEGTTEEQIKSLTKLTSGPDPLQSFSETEAGALWYYKHFAIEQNKRGKIAPDKAWVLIVTTPQNVNILCSANEFSLFLSDFYEYLNDKKDKDAKTLKKIAIHANALELRKQNEIICQCEEKIKAKVIDVMIPNKN